MLIFGIIHSIYLIFLTISILPYSNQHILEKATIEFTFYFCVDKSYIHFLQNSILIYNLQDQ